jgi:hypothetical protein
MTNKHELLTINEAAEVTRAPVATLRYWRHLGVGPRSFGSAAGWSTCGMTSRAGSRLRPMPRRRGWPSPTADPGAAG